MIPSFVSFNSYLDCRLTAAGVDGIGSSRKSGFFTSISPFCQKEKKIKTNIVSSSWVMTWRASNKWIIYRCFPGHLNRVDAFFVIHVAFSVRIGDAESSSVESVMTSETITKFLKVWFYSYHVNLIYTTRYVICISTKVSKR